MAKRKTKPATDGERLELRWLRRVNGPVSLSEFRRLDDFVNERVAAKAHDRAIARAVRKERERCEGLVAAVRDAGRQCHYVSIGLLARLLDDINTGG